MDAKAALGPEPTSVAHAAMFRFGVVTD